MIKSGESISVSAKVKTKNESHQQIPHKVPYLCRFYFSTLILITSINSSPVYLLEKQLAKLHKDLLQRSLTAQWFLTEVHYRYNSVLTIRDLSALWSITVLDLSHNNITEINGLQSLK